MSQFNQTYLDQLTGIPGLDQAGYLDEDEYIYKLLQEVDRLNITTIGELLTAATRMELQIDNSTRLQDLTDQLHQVSSEPTAQNENGNTIESGLAEATQTTYTPTMTTTDEYSRMETITNGTYLQ